MRNFRKTVFSFCFSMATSWSHKFNASISTDVNDDDEYRYTPFIVRLVLVCQAYANMHQNRVSRSRNGLYMPDRAKNPEIDFPLT